MALLKELSVTDLTLLGVGNIIGSGIFILFSTILNYSRKDVFWAVLFACIPNLIAALAYAELSSLYNKNELEYLCVKEAFNDDVASFSTYVMLAFMFLNAATVLLFVSRMIGGKNATVVLLAFLICVLNLLGVSLTHKITNTIGVVEIVLFATLFLFAFKDLKVPEMANIKHQNFWIASFMSMFLYFGYDTIVKLSEESKENVSLALVLSVTISAAIYISLAWVASSSPNFEELAHSHTPITRLWRQFVHKDSKHMINLVSFFIVFNLLFITMLSVSRYVYGLAGSKLPIKLKEVNMKFHTPHNAIAIMFVVVVLIAILLHVEAGIVLSNVVYLIFMILIMVCTIILKKKRIEHRHITVPTYVLCFGVGLCIVYIFIGFSYFGI